MYEFSHPAPDRRPAATPEQQTAFKGVHALMERLTSLYGTPRMILDESATSFISVNEENAQKIGYDFYENSRHVPASIKNTHGENWSSWITVLNAEDIDKTKTVGLFVVSPSGSSHPAHVFKLYNDYTIEQLYRGETYDGISEDGTLINWEEQITHVGWLDTDQMRGLEEVIATAEPSTDTRSVRVN